MTDVQSEQQEERAPQQGDTPHGFWQKNRDYIIIGILYVWLALLIIGVVAEIFHIQSILDWWIWKPPGKP
jgi:hypothetical protein